MYAITATGGKQYRAPGGDIIRVEKLGIEAGQAVVFDQVFAVGNGEMTVGAPAVPGANVSATVLRETKVKKIVVYKYKAKLGYHKKSGYRQLYVQAKIDKINA